MTLQELMIEASDETWFCVVTPDGEEHIFWNADFVGGDDEVLKELLPLVDREFYEFEVVLRDDPDAMDVMNADKVPMVWVGLLMTEDELERNRIDAMKGDGI